MKLSNEFMQILIPAIVGLVSSVTTILVARTNNSKDLTVNERQQLSEDEKQFRAELMGVINSYKADLEASKNELKVLRQEMAELHEINLELRTEVANLHKLNLELTVDNKQLQLKVDGLTKEVQMFKKDKR
jgi:uncharacterized protein involved in exopolysaccharide biosynthesis